MNLEHFLEQRFPKGLSYDDTAQLCLRLYRTLDQLPPEVGSQCTKENLARVFSSLSSKGFVVGSALTASAYGANHHSIIEKGHWIEVIASIFKMRDTVDVDRGEKLILQLMAGSE